MVFQRTEIDPHSALPQDLAENLNVFDDVVRRVDEEASHDRIPLRDLIPIDVHELSCNHRQFGVIANLIK
jgi:hypothetical protein